MEIDNNIVIIRKEPFTFKVRIQSVVANKPKRLHNIHHCKIKDLESISLHHVDTIIFDTFIYSHILGLLLLKNLTNIKMNVISITDEHIKCIRAFKILEKYLVSKDILSCQEELIEAGLKEYAQI